MRDADYFLLTDLKKELEKKEELEVPILRCHSSTVQNNCWIWTPLKTEISFYQVNNQGVKVLKGGSFLLMVRVPGVSSGNQGYAELKVNNSSIGQAWGNNPNGYHNMLYFNEILDLNPNDVIQIANVNLSHSFNMGQPLATSFHLYPLRLKDDEKQDGKSDRHSYLRCQSNSCDGNGGYWNWIFKAGDNSKFDIQNNAINIKQDGNYLVMIRVPGTGNGNNAYADLRLNGSSIAQSWNNNANNYHNMIYFNEILDLKAGDRLQVALVNLVASFNMGQPLATNFSIIKM